MKKLSFLALAVAGLLLGACSDKEVVQEVQNPVNIDFKDGGFIGISLSLPSADATTRANDSLSNGIAEEFAVKNATLYIFKLDKTSTANPDVAATYVDKVSLGNTYDKDKEGGIDPDEWGIQPGVGDTKITSTYSEATLIPNALASEMKADTQNKYYAYVIINHNGQVDVADGDTFKDFSDQVFDEIGADIALEQYIWETGLLMTNSPICDKPGGSAAPDGGKYSTLVELDNQKIYGSKTEAEENPAACVYVERAAVKITVEDNRGETTIGGLTATIDGWKVINVEPTYYNTRHINDNGDADPTKSTEDWGPYNNEKNTKLSTLYRFVSLYQFLPTLPGTTGHTTGYRTYFAKDVQYNADATLLFTNADDDRPWIAVGKHAYTTENTFDVAHQTWQNTTMVTLKVTIGDEGFFTVGKGSQIMYVDDADMTVAGAKSGVQKAAAAIENILKSDNDVAQALAELRTEVSENHVGQEVKSGLAVTFSIPKDADDNEVGKTGVSFTVTPNYTIGGVAYTAFNLGDEADYKDDLLEAINNVLYTNPTETDPTKLEYTDAVLLSYYAGGESYYNVRIKHFGDYETPWSPSLSAALEEDAPGSGYIAGGGDGVNEIYFGLNKTANLTDADNKAKVTLGQSRFLGRYGVVRDNWYKLSIDKIGKIGDAEPVDPSTTTPDTPDDEIENYISVHVHILPWVLREQSVQF